MKRLSLLLLVCTLAITSLSAQSKSPLLFESGNSSIKIGGFIRFVSLYDFNGAINNFEFIPSLMTTPNAWDNNSRTSIDGSASRLSLKFTQKTEKLGNIEFYFESDFRGASDVLRLRQAYVSLLGFTFGQTWSYWYDPSAFVNTIDIQGTNSRTFFRTPLVGYIHNFSDKISAGISLEMPKAKYTTPTGLKALNQATPDIPFFLQYKSKGGHIRIAGLYRSIKYGVISESTEVSKSGLGLQIGASKVILPGFTMTSNLLYGSGIARYINDLAALNLDIVQLNNNSGMQTLPMYSFSLGTKVELSSKLYLSANYSVAGLSSGEEYVAPNEYRRGTYFSSSLFWSAYKNLTLATEYLYGTRVNMGGAEGFASRTQFMVMYNF